MQATGQTCFIFNRFSLYSLYLGICARFSSKLTQLWPSHMLFRQHTILYWQQVLCMFHSIPTYLPTYLPTFVHWVERTNVPKSYLCFEIQSIRIHCIYMYAKHIYACRWVGACLIIFFVLSSLCSLFRYVHIYIHNSKHFTNSSSRFSV